MVQLAELRHALKHAPPVSTRDLCQRLGGIDRATLLRWVRRLDHEVVRCGQARRSAYALRRAIRGRLEPLPLYRIDAVGSGHLVGHLSLIEPEGSAVAWSEVCPWPLDSAMREGWFEGLPYMLYDMAPQGFLGRHFAHRYAQQLRVSERLLDWSDADLVHVLSTLGHDQPGDLIVGEAAFEAELHARNQCHPVTCKDYPELAERALALGEPGSSAGGEHPKFTALVERDGRLVSVIVKFSGADSTPVVRRWADLLIAEHVALTIVSEMLEIPAARTRIIALDGRTFLEVERFDRLNDYGRAPICTLASLNPALIGRAAEPWPVKAADLSRYGWLPVAELERLRRLWWFGQLIANTDMHDGNLAFRPGLTLAPAYDMLPMRYAPTRTGEVPPVVFQPPRPRPEDQEAWAHAHHAACYFWERIAAETRFSPAFAAIASQNAEILLRISG